MHRAVTSFVSREIDTKRFCPERLPPPRHPPVVRYSIHVAGGNKMETVDPDKLKDIEKEFQALLVFCREQGMSDKDIRRVFAPVLRFGSRWKVFFAFTSLVLVIWGLVMVEYFAWHFSAIGRIAMVKMLQVYDWRGLKNTRGCLLEKEYIGRMGFEECYFCEGLKYVAYSDDTNAEFLKEKYLDIEQPVIIPYNITNSTDLSNIFTTIINDDYSDTIPCKLATNILGRKGRSVYEILLKINRHDSFFAHFQNCDFDSVKKFRRMVPRPAFYVPEVSPVQYSWIIVSRDYDVDVFKDIALNDRIAAIFQILGSNTYRLTPLKGCRSECRQLQTELYAGEVLVLTSRWDLAYRPEAIGENFAVILESH